MMALNKQTSTRFDLLTQPSSHVIATYIWLDTECSQILRTKSRTLDFEPQSIEQVPEWDCSIANATTYINSDFYIKPIRLFKDPFFSSSSKNKLVLCENYKHDKTIADENKRVKCKEMFEKLDKFTKSKPKFIIEQIYSMYENTGTKRIDHHLDKTNSMLPKWFHYCSVGIDRVTGRNVAECHYKACLYAGVNIKSVNSEKNLSEWKFEIGPCETYELADQLLIAKYILHRVAEDFDVVVKFDSQLEQISANKLYFSIEEKDIVLKNVNSINDALNKVGLKLNDNILLMNAHINNGLSGILKLIHEENKVELNEILERHMQLKNGQKTNFVNQLFTSNSKLNSNFSCFFQIKIIEQNSNSNYSDPYLLLDQLIRIMLSLLDPDVY